jgi:predicted nucleic acid-binding protein
LIERGLIELPLIRRIAERPVKPIGALLPGPDSLEAQLRRYLDRGESVESIAVALNRSTRMIMHHMSRLGLSQPSGRKKTPR